MKKKESLTPMVHRTAVVFWGANIIGDVELARRVFIPSFASIRADEGHPFYVGDETNIQDFVQLHGLHDRYVSVDGKKYSIYVGRCCSLAHGCLIHGPVFIGDDTFVGFRAEVSFSKVGAGCFIGHNSVVRGVEILPNRLVSADSQVISQSMADALPRVSKKESDFAREVFQTNCRLRNGYSNKRYQVL